MDKVVSVAEMQEIEKLADGGGHSYAEMMDQAGLGLSRFIQSRYGGTDNKHILGLVGSGNNGGDTLLALADLQRNGWETCAVLYKSRSENDPVLARATSSGIEILSLEDGGSPHMLDARISESSLILDGVLGTGFRLPLKGPLAKNLKHVAEFKGLPIVIAVDCPSGVDCDSGEAASECIRADVTVTMAAVKQGLLKLPAFQYAGEIVVVDIGIPDDFPALQARKRFVVDQSLVNSVLPERRIDSHKGIFGTGFIVAGSINYPGAAFLSAKSAYRIGCGLVQLASLGFVQTSLAGSIPEVTWLILPQEMGVIASSAADVVLSNLDRATALLVGPGLGKEEPTREFIKNLLRERILPKKKGGIGFLTGKEDVQEQAVNLPPVIFDADGLNLLCEIPKWASLLPPESILTPHPGEMSRLTGMSVKEIQQDRLGTAEKYARDWNQIVVLKGAITIIAHPDGRSAFIPVATSALAKAGTGDVLSGIILGLSSQGLAPFDAAWAGAWIHAQAGLFAVESVGHPASVLAGDVCEHISSVYKKLLQLE